MKPASYSKKLAEFDAAIAEKQKQIMPIADRPASARALADAAAYATPSEIDVPDTHRNAPRPDRACLYGLVGEVAKAGSDTTEANEFAVALNFIAYMSACVGRGVYMPVGNTWHHARIFGLHVGRTGRGRKGDAVSLVHRIDMAVRASEIKHAPQVHRGGLSTREGLVFLLHDGYKDGKTEVEAIHDKRLWIVESEFSNVLQQAKRDGNTLSSALRDGWDGVDLKPATKTNRLWASNPHISLSVSITPTELRALMASRELTNGFANRFLLIWAERTKLMSFPTATPQALVNDLAKEVIAILKFVQADIYERQNEQEMQLSVNARKLYDELYRGELNDQGAGELINALLERRAPTLLRLAMVFALTDRTFTIDRKHIEAANAWIQYWSDSTKFVFASALDEVTTAQTTETAEKIVAYLGTVGNATRWELTKKYFRGQETKTRIDAALDELLASAPPRILIETVPRPNGQPGSPTKNYSLSAKSAKSAKDEHLQGFARDFQDCEVSEVCEASPPPNESSHPPESTLRRLRTLRKPENQAVSRANTDCSHTSHTSQPSDEKEVL